MADIYLGEDVQVTLTIVYILLAIASVWLTLFSSYILDWMGVKMHKKPKDVRDWPKIFLILLILQPVSFMISAVGLWWIGAFAYVPPAHFGLTLISLIAIDFFREEEPWEKMYDYTKL